MPRKRKHSGIIKGLTKMIDQLLTCVDQNQEQVKANDAAVAVIKADSKDCLNEATKAKATADKLQAIVG